MSCENRTDREQRERERRYDRERDERIKREREEKVSRAEKERRLAREIREAVDVFAGRCKD